MKPDFVFFGESISEKVKDRRYEVVLRRVIVILTISWHRSYSIIENADRLFIIGTTLATYSAFRCVPLALSAHIRNVNTRIIAY